jgi:hypothetical protein
MKAACFFVLFLWVMGVVGAMDSKDAELAAKAEPPTDQLQIVNFNLE